MNGAYPKMYRPSVIRLIENAASMNASRVDHPRTSPVALRTNTARSTSPEPDATVAMLVLLQVASSAGGVLAAGQHEVLHLLLAVEIDDDAEQLSLLVTAPRVDAEGLPEPMRPARLLDVAG